MDKKELPPIKNVGVMDIETVNRIVGDIEDEAGGKVFTIRGDVMITLLIAGSPEKLLTAAHLHGKLWHVRAREGLLDVVKVREPS